MTQIDQPLRHLGLFFLVAFGLLGLHTGFYAYAQRDDVLARPENPRPIIAERRLNRGAILDRHGTQLALTEGLPGNYIRSYPVLAAAPVVGYLSINYGATAIEAAYNTTLRGDERTNGWQAWVDQNLLNLPQQGYPVQLTLDADWQQRAFEALNGHAGAVVVLNGNGEILALASAPTFDPNTLDADWANLIEDPNSPLLNRATLGRYRLDNGLAVWIAAAAERFNVATPTPTQMYATWQDLGLLDAPTLPLNTPPFDQAEVQRVLNAPTFLTQPSARRLQIAPLNLAWAMLTIAQQGRRPPLSLVSSIGSAATNGELQPITTSASDRATLSPEDAAAIETWLRQNGAAPPDATGFSATALQFPGATTIGWWAGYTNDRDLVLVVLLEDATAIDAYRAATELLADRP